MTQLFSTWISFEHPHVGSPAYCFVLLYKIRKQFFLTRSLINVYKLSSRQSIVTLLDRNKLIFKKYMKRVYKKWKSRWCNNFHFFHLSLESLWRCYGAIFCVLFFLCTHKVIIALLFPVSRPSSQMLTRNSTFRYETHTKREPASVLWRIWNERVKSIKIFGNHTKSWQLFFLKNIKCTSFKEFLGLV